MIIMGNKNRTPSHRYANIQRQLLMEGTVSVDSLAHKLGVSVATIRRDLTMLENTGAVLRTHGGATIPQQRGADQAFALREQIDRDGKRFIARAALELVADDQTLFMNDGSTVLALADELVASDMTLTVVTTGVNIASALSENPNITTYLAGGLVRHRTLATSGDFVEQMLSTINADTAFIAAEGFSVDEGLTHSYEADAKIARTMHLKTRQTIALATAGKLGRCDRITGIPASEIDVLITDCQKQQTVRSIRGLGISVIIAEDAEYDSEKTRAITL